MSKISVEYAKSIFPKPYSVTTLEYDLQSIGRLNRTTIEDLIIGLTRAYKALNQDDNDLFTVTGPYERKKYLEELVNFMCDYYYDKLTRGMRDDELTDKFHKSIEDTVVDWYELVDMIVHTNNFDSLYRFIKGIVDKKDTEAISFKVYKDRVFIEYGIDV